MANSKVSGANDAKLRSAKKGSAKKGQIPPLPQRKGKPEALARANFLEVSSYIRDLMSLPIEDEGKVTVEFRYYCVRVSRTSTDGLCHVNAVLPRSNLGEPLSKSWAVETDGKQMEDAFCDISSSYNEESEDIGFAFRKGWQGEHGKLVVAGAGMDALMVDLPEAKLDRLETELVKRYWIEDRCYPDIEHALGNGMAKTKMIELAAEIQMRVFGVGKDQETLPINMLRLKEEGEEVEVSLPVKDFLMPWKVAPVIDSEADHATLVETRSSDVLRMGRAAWRFDFTNQA